MAIYIVTYDLTEASKVHYERLLELIKQEGSWACLGGSSYLVESDHTAVELRDRYCSVLTNEDMLYVGLVTAPAAWHGYSKEISNWILKKLQ